MIELLLAFCIAYVPPPLFQDFRCAAEPKHHRAFYPTTFKWKGGDYLLVSHGNELRIFDINNPPAVTTVSYSGFGVGNLGDSDYDLTGFTICDDCRFGVAYYKLATVFFDFGTAQVPKFESFRKDGMLRDLEHGMTYKVGNEQFLFMADENNGPCGVGSGLYRMGTNVEAGIEFMYCLSEQMKIIGGMQVDDDTVWISDGSVIYISDVGPSGHGSLYAWTPGAFRGTSLRGAAKCQERAVSVRNGVMRMWDFSAGPTPALLSETITGGPYSIAELDGDLVWLGTYNATGSETTYDVWDPAAPVQYHDSFWDTGNAWNDWPCATIQTGSAIKDQWMYAGRYEVLQLFNFNGCEYGPQCKDPCVFMDGFETGGTEEWQ